MDYPIILPILSYNDEQLYNLISKSLRVYSNSGNLSELPISLILKTNIYHEFEDVLFHRRFRPNICALSASLGNLAALQWFRNPGQRATAESQVQDAADDDDDDDDDDNI